MSFVTAITVNVVTIHGIVATIEIIVTTTTLVCWEYINKMFC